MDIKLTLVFVGLFIFGLIVMITHKFYKYDTSDMLFATKLRVFLGGLLSSVIGVYGIVKAILAMIN